MRSPTKAKTVDTHSGIRPVARKCSGLLALLFAFPIGADETHRAVTGVPQVEACSQRYAAAEAPRLSQASGSGLDAVRQAFHTSRHWGEENLERLGTELSGLDEASLRVHYPAGSSSPSDTLEGGAGFYSDPPSLRGSERACLSYMLRFPPDFDFVQGGKLPGLYGGEAPSGGEDVDGTQGFSQRLMWRENGQGELYPYVVGFEGASIGRGSWHFPVGRWVQVEQEVVLNDPGQENGLVRIWIDGQPVLEQQNVIFRTTPDITIDGLMFSTFFGGTGEGWRTPRDQYVDFAAFRFFTSRP